MYSFTKINIYLCLIIIINISNCASSPNKSKLLTPDLIKRIKYDRLRLNLKKDYKNYSPFIKYTKMYKFNDLKIKHNLGYIKGKKHNLFTQTFRPKAFKRVIIIVHGFNNHSGYNKKIISLLLKQKFAVISFDLPGHGLSSGKQAHIDSFLDYGLAVKDVINFVLKNLKVKPSIIGHSTGCSAIIESIYNFNTSFDQIIFTAPLIRSAYWTLSKFGTSIASPFSETIPRAFRKSSHDNDYLSFQKNVDPLAPKKIHLSWVKSLQKWNELNVKYKPLKRKVLIIQGTADDVVDYVYNLSYIKKRFSTSIIMIKGARHEIFNESNKYFLQFASILNNYF